jgi:hypothetical protein
MGEDITYFAIIREGDSPEQPAGIARAHDDSRGRLDETLRRNLIWMRDAVIHERERGEETGTHLVRISEADATRLIRRFRQEWRPRPG